MILQFRKDLSLKKGINYILINNIEKFDIYKVKVVDLLILSQSDDAILGFDNTFNNQDSKLYLDSLGKDIIAQKLQILIGLTDELVVICCFLKKSHQQTTKHICDLQKGMIHPSLRGFGFLQKTLAIISHECLVQGIDLITLDVRGGSKAHLMWQRCGFETYGVLNDYSRYENKSFDGYFMKQKTLDLWDRFKKFK